VSSSRISSSQWKMREYRGSGEVTRGTVKVLLSSSGEDIEEISHRVRWIS
jgi:hypothetical protein